MNRTVLEKQETPRFVTLRVLLLRFQNSKFMLGRQVGKCVFRLRGSPVLMEVSSVSPRVPPPGNLGRGWFFCAKSPTLGDKLLSNFPRVGQWVGDLFMQRFWFCLSKMVACLSNWLKKIRWKCRRTFWESFVVVFVTYRHKWFTENSR